MQKVKEMLNRGDHSDSTTGAQGNPTTLDNPAHNTDMSSATGTKMGTMTDSSNIANTNPRTGDGIHTATHGNDVTGSGIGHSSSSGSGLAHSGSGVNSSTSGSSLPAVGTGSGRAEENNLGNTSVTGQTGDFKDPHSLGHDHSIASKFDPSAATTHHDHKHLQHVTHRHNREVEVEEVERQKEHERNIHHVQHHVQPVHHKTESDEVHHQNIVPQTKIHEKHVSSDEDHKLFSGLASKHKDTEVHAPKERTVVDLGEKVHETVHHHVHHVTQPVVEHEHVERHRIHTVIPTHHVTHEAPIVHKSSVHEPVSMESFLSGGGKLDSGITHDKAGVLNSGEGCERTVDGVGEKLARDLNLRSGTTSSEHAGTTRI